MQQSQQLISVIIPTHNRAQLVQRAVQSVLCQTHQLLEVIVVQDGGDAASEAATRQGLSAFADARLKYLVLPDNQGASAARNLGIQAARGNWLALLDDDDDWHPEKLQRQLLVAQEARGSLVLVASRFTMQDQAHSEIWPRRLPAADEALDEYLFCRKSAFQGDGLLLTSTLLFTRQLAEQLHFDTTDRSHQEWRWLLEAARLPGFEWIVCPQVLGTWHADSNRDRLSSGESWQASLAWGKSVRHLVSASAYAGFLSSVAAANASHTADWGAVIPLSREMLVTKGARFKDWAVFAANFLIPGTLRRRIRTALSG